MNGNSKSWIDSRKGHAAGVYEFDSASNFPRAVLLSPGNYLSGSDAGLPTGAGPLSISVWFQSAGTASNQPLVSYGTAAAEEAVFLLADGTQIKYSSYATMLDGGTFTANVWNQAFLTVSGTTATLFLNGTQVATGTLTTNVVLGGTLFIGRDVAGESFSGEIASVRIWNRVLTDGEIAALHGLGIGADYYSNLSGDLRSGLLRAYDLNASPFRNSAGSGYALTATGAPEWVAR